MNVSVQNFVSAQKRTIEIFSNDDEFIKEAMNRLESMAVYEVRAMSAESFFDLTTHAKQPCVSIIDVEAGSLLHDARTLDAVAAKSGTPVIVVAKELSAEDMRFVVKLNAADLLYKPINCKELINAVATQASVGAVSNSKIETFISANGGAGASTLALATIDHLASKSPDKGADCCIVDLDFVSAACGAYLNQTSEYDLSGVVDDPSRLDVEILDVMKLTGVSGFSMYSFEIPGLPFAPHGSEFVLKLLDLAAYRYRNIVIDLPYFETPWQNSVISASDTIYIVFEINLASLRQAKKLLHQIHALRCDDLEIKLVANKAKTKWLGNHISVKEIRKLFDDSQVELVRFQPDLLTEALNRGMLPSQVQSSSRFQKDIKALIGARSYA